MLLARANDEAPAASGFFGLKIADSAMWRQAFLLEGRFSATHTVVWYCSREGSHGGSDILVVVWYCSREASHGGSDILVVGLVTS